jgi:hypothetical protein
MLLKIFCYGKYCIPLLHCFFINALSDIYLFIFIILRYDITVDDVRRGVNDTTSAALLTGTTISGGRQPKIKGTTCHMHAQELVVTHALGLRTRRKRGFGVIDEFESGKLVSKIMDKKAKSRFVKYKEFCKNKLSMDVIKLLIPNETRVSGVFTMYESLLRSMKCINQYCLLSTEANLYSDVILTEKQWTSVAETYALLLITNRLAMTSQIDSVDANCFSYFNVAKTRDSVLKITQMGMNVVDVNSGWAPTIEPSAIPTVHKEYFELEIETQNLIDRFVKEYDNYFPFPDSDQIQMMLLHPVMAWKGLE